jgi:hypothetical protein
MSGKLALTPMRSKEEYYTLVKEIREVLSKPENLRCTCPKIKCEWHNNCQKCIAQHRYYKKHIPNCMQDIFNAKIKEVAKIFELDAIEKDRTPNEYWDYVKQMDNSK